MYGSNPTPRKSWRRAVRFARIVALAAVAAGGSMLMCSTEQTPRTGSASVWRAHRLPFLSSDHKPTLPLAIDKLA
jgi:hypothetical protein